jgi:hypothetical protein
VELAFLTTPVYGEIDPDPHPDAAGLPCRLLGHLDQPGNRLDSLVIIIARRWQTMAEQLLPCSLSAMTSVLVPPKSIPIRTRLSSLF